MGKYNIADIYMERISEIEKQIKIAGYRKDKCTIAKLAAEKKRLQSYISEQNTLCQKSKKDI